MGSVPIGLAADLQDGLALRRAVETGTHVGGGTRALAGVFGEVVSIELFGPLHRRAYEELTDLENVRLILGDSALELPGLAAERIPTLYWLDSHWSGDSTAGAQRQCPVLAEIAALRRGDPSDCVIADDARLFAAAPPPPQDPKQWPTLIEVLDAIRAIHPAHHVTVLRDLVIAVPAEMKPVVDYFGQHPANGLGARAPRRRSAAIRALASTLERVRKKD